MQKYANEILTKQDIKQTIILEENIVSSKKKIPTIYSISARFRDENNQVCELKMSI